MKKIISFIQKLILSMLFIACASNLMAQDSAEVFIGLGHKGVVRSSFVSEDAKYAATVADDGFKLWNYETGTLVKTVPPSKIEGFTSSLVGWVSERKTVALTDNSQFIIYKNGSEIITIDITNGEMVGNALPHDSALPVPELISPDSKLITTVSSGRVSVFEIATGKKIQEANIIGSLHDLAYSGDGKHLFISTKRGQKPAYIYKFDIGTGDIQSVYRDKVEDANALAFAQNGTKGITVMRRRRIEIWDLATGNTLHKMRERESYLKRSARASDAWLSADGSVGVIEFSYQPEYGIYSVNEYMLINTTTGELIKLLDYREYGERVVSISADNNYIALDPGGTSDWIEFYDIKKGSLSSIDFESELLSDFNFAPGKNELLVVHNKTVERRNLETKEIIEVLGEEIGTIGPSSFAMADGRLLSGRNLWDIKTGELLQSFKQIIPHNNIRKKANQVLVLAVAPDGRSVIIPDANGYTFREFDLVSKRFTKSYEVSNNIQLLPYAWLWTFKFSPDGTKLVAAYKKTNGIGKKNAFIQIWDTETGMKIQKIAVDASSVNGIDVSPDGKLLLVATGFQKLGAETTNQLALFDLQTGQKIRTIAQNQTRGGMYWDPQFFPDGSKITADGTIWDTRSGSVIKKFDFDFKGVHDRITISPDGKKLISNIYGQYDWGLGYLNEVIDLKTDSSAFTLRNATSSLFSRDGLKIFATGANGELVTYDGTTGDKLATSVVFANGEWVTVTPKGYYDASTNGANHLKVRIGIEVFPMDNFFSTYYRPDIVQAALGGRDVSQLADSDIRTNAELPPSVTFTSPSVGITSAKRSLTLIAEITDRGGGIGEVRLTHNGKTISSDTRGLKLVSTEGRSVTREFTVSLLQGENIFELTAFSSGQRIESNPARLVVNYEGIVATSDLYVLAVGLNEYKNASLNLNYGRPDAEAFVQAVKTQSGNIFKSVNVTALYDGKATRSSVKAAFEEIISKAKPQDTFLFFYAGHGVMSEPMGNQPGDFYMALHETIQLYGNNDGLAAHGISASEMTELSRRIKARKQLIVLDACQSGGAVKTFAMRGAAEQKAIIQLARSAGLVVMASTGTQQYATEFQALGHGVFTYALLGGLSGKADGGSEDGKITVKELEAFINDRVPALTTKHRGQAQYPNSYARGQDFPISIVIN